MLCDKKCQKSCKVAKIERVGSCRRCTMLQVFRHCPLLLLLLFAFVRCILTDHATGYNKWLAYLHNESLNLHGICMLYLFLSFRHWHEQKRGAFLCGARCSFFNFFEQREFFEPLKKNQTKKSFLARIWLRLFDSTFFDLWSCLVERIMDKRNISVTK